jgi:hypothetical protein
MPQPVDRLRVATEILREFAVHRSAVISMNEAQASSRNSVCSPERIGSIGAVSASGFFISTAWRVT